MCFGAPFVRRLAGRMFAPSEEDVMKGLPAYVAVVLLLVSADVRGQLQTNHNTMLPPETIRALADELSGSRAYQNVLDIAAYEHVRPAEEYTGTYRESAVVEKLARDYGFSNVRITRLPMAYKQWAGQQAELSTTEPERRVVSRYEDNPGMLAVGSQSADVTAPLVWVGLGIRDSDYEGKDVRGKIVLTNGTPGAVHDLAVRKFGAAGVISFVNEYGFGLDRPDQIAEGGQAALSNAARDDMDARTTFAIMLSTRQGTRLFEDLEAHPVTVHVTTKSARYPSEHQVVEGWIPGDGTTDQEVVIVGHLFEGIAKQGANDDTSGCGASLEIGRTWAKLIRDGVLPRPRRAVHFLWVPEIIYATEYWKKFPDFPKKVVAMTSMDIVGSDQTVNKNEQRVLLTPYSFPSFLNDLYTQFMTWMEDTQAVKYHNLRGTTPETGRYMQDPITDPQGSQDPYHIRIMKHAGGSDHLPFLRSYPRVAGVHFMNWPDVHYHTSEDKPNYLDPTQLKRTAIVTMSVSLVMANAAPDDALLLGGLTAGGAVERIGRDLVQATGLLRAAPAADLAIAYKEGLVLIRQAYKREAAAIRSNALLMSNDARALASLREIETSVVATEAADVAKLQSVYRAVAVQRSQTPVLMPAPTASEDAAARLFPTHKSPNPYDDFAVTAVPPAQPSMHPGQRERSLYDEEAINFADGTRSVLEIRDALSAELGPIDVQVVERFFRDLEKTGNWTLRPQPSTASAARD
jgi:aminopeptidase YwaD